MSTSPPHQLVAMSCKINSHHTMFRTIVSHQSVMRKDCTRYNHQLMWRVYGRYHKVDVEGLHKLLDIALLDKESICRLCL